MKLVMTAAAAVLALGIGSMPAYAQDDNPGASEACVIQNQGNGNNIACGDLVVGDNSIVGEAHQVRRSSTSTPQYTIENQTDQILTFTCSSCSPDVLTIQPNTSGTTTLAGTSEAFVGYAGTNAELFLGGNPLNTCLLVPSPLTCAADDPGTHIVIGLES
ncbi:hypothetical protein GCM10022295_93010 [Streptomyces osmaniensis]|uniref:Secreted protein n=2 Tax=Streptomyces osmaniensis TaxID=593134 RepID=A0ABP6Z3V0_9ACTN